MDDLRNLWQNQEVDQVTFSVEELRARTVKFQSRIRWRNLREQAACLFVILAFAAASVKSQQTVPRISYALMIAGAAYIVWHIRKWGSANSLPADLGRANCIRFYRGELERQRDLLRGIWRWYLGPLIPGLVLLIAYAIVIAPPDRRWFPVVYSVVAAAFIWMIGRINRRAARGLEHQIAELDRERPGA